MKALPSFHLVSSRFPQFLGGAGMVLLLVACSKPAPVEEPVRSVKVMVVGDRPLGLQREYAGEVRARVESRLGFRVAGKITRRAVEAGQHVKAGTLLAQLDPADYQLAAQAASAQVNAATIQRDLAAADLRRYQALREQNFISGAELERREASLRAAQATLEQAQAQQAGQGNQAGYTRLLADASGVVTAVEAEAGQVVAAGAPVLRLAHDGARDVVFAVPEDQLASVPVGRGVVVRAWAGGTPLEGQVREVAASADPVTRTYAVKVALAGPEVPALGATAYVTLPTPVQGPGAVAAIKLPTSALRQEGQGSAVWVLDPASMTVRSQAVQVATVDGNEAVIAAGLRQGMQVVTAGVHVLAPGQKVMIYQEKYAKPSVDRASSAVKTGPRMAAATAGLAAQIASAASAR